MQPHEKTKKLLARVEPVEQLYDGLNGKIIKWTLENGGTSHDPSCLAFLVGRDGKVASMCPGPKAYNASGFADWLQSEVDKYEKAHPRTRVPFVPPTIEEQRCLELDAAREAKKNVLIYVARESADEKDKPAQKQCKACRKFEKGTLGSKKAAEAAKGWVLLRFDLADKAHAEFLKGLGMTTAPALWMWKAADEKPSDIGTKLKGPNLAYVLKKP